MAGKSRAARVGCILLILSVPLGIAIAFVPVVPCFHCDQAGLLTTVITPDGKETAYRDPCDCRSSFRKGAKQRISLLECLRAPRPYNHLPPDLTVPAMFVGALLASFLIFGWSIVTSGKCPNCAGKGLLSKGVLGESPTVQCLTCGGDGRILMLRKLFHLATKPLRS